MKKSLIKLLLVSLFILPFKVAGQESWYETGYNMGYDVPYVPTRYEVVDEMLKMANVSKDDIIYDLGCGDGRIVITAAEKMGTHGVGIDIDPQRIKESTENAVNAKVTERVQFLQQDLFEAEITDATVVALYLLSSVNLKLRPKLLRELKPGTRIVSHNYDMGDWQYEQMKEVNTNMGSHTVYYWVVPSNVSGTWEWTMPAGTGEKRYVLHLVQEFQEFNGTVTVSDSKIPIKKTKLSGDGLQFTIEQEVNGQTVSMQFEGHVSGNSIEGSVNSKVGLVANKSTWKAERDPSTVTPLDNSEVDSN